MWKSLSRFLRNDWSFAFLGACLIIAFCILTYVMFRPIITGCETEKRMLLLPAGKVLVPMWADVCK